MVVLDFKTWELGQVWGKLQIVDVALGKVWKCARAECPPIGGAHKRNVKF